MMRSGLPFWLIVPCLVTLTGCSAPHNQPQASSHLSPPAMQQTWQVENCHATKTHTNMTLTTDGRLSGEHIMFRLTSDTPLHRAPDVALNAFENLTFTVEGHGQHYSFEFPYNSREVAALLHTNSYIVVRYLPVGAREDFSALFRTQGLPAAISQLASSCPPPESTRIRRW